MTLAGADLAGAMPRIERVMLLQSVPLFKFCTVEEVLRIAAIAGVARFAEGQQVYRADEPARALYCVVEGLVRIEGEGLAPREIGPRRSFGVLEILSGRLRRATAYALEPTRALQIEAEDFFDLLSNNIEIVKALFREILDAPSGDGRGGLA
ncbi:MAG TPA: cyclic nucleotide-binding domain-containing protein [Thermoanaerobaculia bacterium]|nr:cyclic nucleotide-binding domain-containing protein [Thermoanaerobaculia bacterium]